MEDEKPEFRWNRMRLAFAMLAAAIVLLLCVTWKTGHHPRTDDASVRANYIQFAPEVTGRLLNIPVKDNDFVHAGSVLFVIDPRPYQYALDQALSDQQLLEEQITDMQRKIASENSAVEAARAGVTGSQTQIVTIANAAHASDAAVERAKAFLQSAEAQQTLALNNLHRIEPLLAKQYVTAQQVDDARTKMQVAEHNHQEAQAALQEAQAQQARSRSMQRETEVGVAVSQARLSESIHGIDRLDSLVAQRPAKTAKVDSAKLDLERCTVVAPFDGYVTNLNISEGEMAKPGVPLFTLIDARNWYVVANYRESELKYITPGKHVDLYLLGNSSRRFDGVVESIGNGVSPDDSNTSNGLPQIDHTLNWVHLAARFPIRIRVENPDPSLFRMGETAISIVR
ncbi:MAG: HlyD family efflux transporter periplasmic adaptor subunit [Acidobacteriaceae bacterium]|nr:HlyD family efflux transporter periplasmic adaptor subunit [Acidobacteriaceae bacterium]